MQRDDGVVFQESVGLEARTNAPEIEGIAERAYPSEGSSSAKSFRIFLSTGEVSGDLQGALLTEALQRQAEQAGIALEILALGGDRMAKAGASLLANTSAIGSIGILESLPYVWSTLQIQRQVKRYLRQQPPDLVVMIDYFGPNLVIGNFVRQALPHVPTVYYIDRKSVV